MAECTVVFVLWGSFIAAVNSNAGLQQKGTTRNYSSRFRLLTRDRVNIQVRSNHFIHTVYGMNNRFKPYQSSLEPLRFHHCRIEHSHEFSRVIFLYRRMWSEVRLQSPRYIYSIRNRIASDFTTFIVLDHARRLLHHSVESHAFTKIK